MVNTKKQLQNPRKNKLHFTFKKHEHITNVYNDSSSIVNISHPGIPYKQPDQLLISSNASINHFVPRTPSHSPPSLSPLDSNKKRKIDSLENVMIKLSPEIQSLETYSNIENDIRNEKYSRYDLMVVHLLFTTNKYDFKHNYQDVVTIRINTNHNIKQQIKHVLMLLTTSKEKKHIIICSTSILQNEEHNLSDSIVKSINKKDEQILKIYNECLQNYSKLNTIHSNISIFHCVIGTNNILNSKDKNITISRLKEVYIDNSTVPVFNKITNFSSLRKNELMNINQPYINAYDENLKCDYKIIPYIKQNDEWWKSNYTFNLLYIRGCLYQITGTCWLHCVINLILLSPLANEAKTMSYIKNAKKMTFLEIANASKDKSLRELFFALLKNMLLRNTYPDPSDGNILLPIAARINGLMYKNDEKNFDDISSGDGNSHVHITTAKILTIFLNNKLMLHGETELSINMTVERLNYGKCNIPPKYALFCGNFENASKTINLYNQIYDLFGSIIGIYYEGSRHTVCGIIVKGQEIIIDSNKILSTCIWSNGSECTYKTIRPILHIRLFNCIYVVRKNKTIS